MKKRIFCLILALVMVLSLAACAGSGNDNTENTKDTTTNTEGSEATTPVSGGEAELALITDANSIDDRGFNQFSWEGLKQYAEENGKTYTYYTPIDQSTQSYLSAIEGAVNNGAKLVVTPGFLFGEAIYKAQTMYPDVHFVLVDATPTLDDDTVIADNTCSIFFAEEQSGFLAGYAAVKEGYRKLGFFGALAVPAVVRFGYGFVDGWGASLGVNYPLAGGVIKGQLSYRDMDNDADVDFTRLSVAAGYDYPVSKRTALYVMAGYSQEKVEDNKAKTDATPNGYELTAGIVHRF